LAYNFSIAAMTLGSVSCFHAQVVGSAKRIEAGIPFGNFATIVPSNDFSWALSRWSRASWTNKFFGLHRGFRHQRTTPTNIRQHARRIINAMMGRKTHHHLMINLSYPEIR